jgi:PUB domain/Ubiquitin family
MQPRADNSLIILLPAVRPLYSAPLFCKHHNMQVFCTITANNGARVPIEVPDDATPTSLRQQVSTATKIPLSQLRLIFRGKMIKDDDSKKAVEEYKLESDCVLHCMGKPEENAASNATPTTTTAVSPTAPTPSVSGGSSMSAVPSRIGVPAAASAPAAAAATTTASSGPPTVDAAILRLRQNNPPSVYETALTTLDKILNNIVTHPMEEKYRKVKRQNPAFSKRLGGLVGGHDCMLAVGFQVEIDGGAEVYQLHASAEQWPKLVQGKAAIANAAEQAKQQQRMPHASAAGVGNLFGAPPGGFPGMIPPGGGSMPPLDPTMQSAMTQMVSNPEALRAALQVRDCMNHIIAIDCVFEEGCCWICNRDYVL